MRFISSLIPGRYIRRYKRFLVDVLLSDGKVETVFCPNTGSMKTCEKEGWPVRMSYSDSPTRKLPLTLEMIHNGRCWIGLNTIRANSIVEEGIRHGWVSELRGYLNIRREVKFGESSRLDFLLHGFFSPIRCYVEVKNVTMVERGAYRFPDAVTKRGQKHLRNLIEAVDEGNRAVILYLIQRSDAAYFEPAADIDPDYAEALVRAQSAGVEVLAYGTHVGVREIRMGSRVEIRL